MLSGAGIELVVVAGGLAVLILRLLVYLLDASRILVIAMCFVEEKGSAK
jgi:hypothetical protein